MQEVAEVQRQIIFVKEIPENTQSGNTTCESEILMPVNDTSIEIESSEMQVNANEEEHNTGQHLQENKLNANTTENSWDLLSWLGNLFYDFILKFYSKL